MQIECRSTSQIKDDDILNTLDAVGAELNDMTRGGPRFGFELELWRSKRRALLKLKADLEAAVVGDPVPMGWFAKFNEPYGAMFNSILAGRLA